MSSVYASWACSADLIEWPQANAQFVLQYRCEILGSHRWAIYRCEEGRPIGLFHPAGGESQWGKQWISPGWTPGCCDLETGVLYFIWAKLPKRLTRWDQTTLAIARCKTAPCTCIAPTNQRVRWITSKTSGEWYPRKMAMCQLTNLQVTRRGWQQSVASAVHEQCRYFHMKL